MLILAIETSTQTGSVALVEAPLHEDGSFRGEKILGDHTLNLPGTHSERLMPSIHSLLQEASLSVGDVQGIALALGPGSFTGLRIGVSTVKGLAYALRVPVAGIPTLDALAHNVQFASTPICPILDARKREVYAALFRGDENSGLEKIGGDWALAPEDLCSRISEKTIFLGNGIEVYGEFLREKLGSHALFAPPELSLPRAVNVARLSLPKFRKGLTLDIFSFTPTYIRRSEAEIQYEAQGRK
ncbi:MAG: tRNA (adenosine(37)-N6)-threonylcarbamoyltransferase complex dimerization subunit type 1 TsaB [Thermodesulfobacteriota bacterium]|jgi:tRNA threonylcarbamoyladenosine biosynthesis protein TsaB